MPRSRAMILTTIWADADFVALSPDAKLVYLLLLSQPDLSHLGVLSLAQHRWARAAGGTPEWVEDCLTDLAAARFIVLDVEAQQVLIRSFLRNDQVCRQPNVLRAACSAIAMVASRRIATALLDEVARISAEERTEKTGPVLDEMKALLGTLGEGFPEPFGEGFAKPHAKGSENPSGNPLGDRGRGKGVTGEVAVRARARGSRIPDPFPITPEMVAWARERVPQVDGKRETEKFVNYWTAKTGAQATKLDWPATWRNWMLGAAERLRSPGSAPLASTTDARVAAALEVGERLQRQMEGGGEPR